MALERKFALWRSGVSFFYQMFVSGAAFSVYKTALVILLQLQFLQPLFFLLALFGFDWIFLNLMELPRAVELLDAYILILLAVKHLQILSLMCPWGSNCVLQLPLNHTVKALIFHSIKPCLVTCTHHLCPPSVWRRRHFLSHIKSGSHIEIFLGTLMEVVALAVDNL